MGEHKAEGKTGRNWQGAESECSVSLISPAQSCFTCLIIHAEFAQN